MWDQLDPSGPHVAYVTVAVFLIFFSLFSRFIKDHLNLSGMRRPGPLWKRSLFNDLYLRFSAASVEP